MEIEQRLPLTDSPWFWALAFSVMALLAILVIGPKYGRRQANIEVKYQARERVMEDLSARNNPDAAPRSDDLAARREFASPGSTLVPLWPLTTVLIVVVLISAVMLYRAQTRPDSSNIEGPS